MDALQTVTFAGLICFAIIPYVVWVWHFKDMFKARIRGNWTVIKRMNLKDTILIIFSIPVMLTGGIGALWLYVKGWEDFPRTIYICMYGGLIGGILIATVMFIFNQIGLYQAKKRKYEIQE